MSKIFLLLLLAVFINGCAIEPVDEKHYCDTQTDCADGSYCEKTDSECVNADRWWKNVGHKYDCLPDPNACSCKKSRCVK